MGKRIEIKARKRYGRLVILGEAPQKNGYRRFDCECDCGELRTVRLGDLRNGNTKSCGCLQKEISTIHGMSNTALYQTWEAMKSRCLNPHNTGFKNYGGRGITVCNEWLNFVSFHEWAMSRSYKDNLTIERLDNELGYFPKNCTFIPRNQQSNNTRRSIRIAYNNRTLALKDWAKEMEINYDTLWGRLNRYGWTVEKAFTEPIRGCSA